MLSRIGPRVLVADFGEALFEQFFSARRETAADHEGLAHFSFEAVLARNALRVRLACAADLELRFSPRAHDHRAPRRRNALAIDLRRIKRQEVEMDHRTIERIVRHGQRLTFV